MDLFDAPGTVETLGPGAALLRGRLADAQGQLLALIDTLTTVSPFRNWRTRSGGTMSVAMTNCGTAGWISDEAGYRYDAIDPLTGAPWPAMPARLAEIASDCARETGFDAFAPDCCLVNRYLPGAALALHRDRDERDRESPIVSVSLGAPATFLWHPDNAERPVPIRLDPGDVVVFGGASRFVRHGIRRLSVRSAPRINLTFRSTGRARPDQKVCPKHHTD